MYVGNNLNLVYVVAQKRRLILRYGLKMLLWQGSGLILKTGCGTKCWTGGRWITSTIPRNVCIELSTYVHQEVRQTIAHKDIPKIDQETDFNVVRPQRCHMTTTLICQQPSVTS